MRLIYFDQLDNFYNWQYIVGRKKDEIRKSQGHTKVLQLFILRKRFIQMYLSFRFKDLKTIHQLISKSLRIVFSSKYSTHKMYGFYFEKIDYLKFNCNLDDISFCKFNANQQLCLDLKCFQQQIDNQSKKTRGIIFLTGTIYLP